MVYGKLPRKLQIFYFGLLCFFFKSCLFQISCDTIPISVSNLTNCVDTQCYYVQYASSSINLQTNGGTCYTFNAPIIDSIQTITYKIYVSILDFSAYYDLIDCYFTDDLVYSVSVNCHCPGSLFTTGYCPCDTGPTAYPNNQFCISGSAYSKGCPFGGVTSYCANIGISAYSRYQVCKLSNPTYSIQINITDTFDNVTHLFSVDTNTLRFVDPSGKFNLSLTNIVTSSTDKTGYYAVYDSVTDTNHLLDNSQCNSIDQYDITKFGFIKFSNQGNLIFKDNIKSGLSIEILDCSSDTYKFTSYLPTLSSFIKHIREPTVINDLFESVPTLKSGYMFYDGTFGITYMGRDIYDNIVIGPYTYTTNSDNFNVSLGIGNSSFGLHYTGQDPYYNSSCILEIFTSRADAWAYQPQKFGVVRCPNTTYAVICSSVTQFLNAYNTTCFAADFSGYFPMIAYVYPDKWHYVGINIDTAVIESPINNTYLNFTARTPTYYSDPIITGSAIVEMSYNGLSINFNSLTVRPIITEFDVDGYLINFVARSTSNPGTCFTSVYTDNLNISVIALKSIFLSTIDTKFQTGIQNVNYTGLMTLVVTCGLYNATATKRVNLVSGIDIPTDYSFSGETFNPFVFNSNLPWYYFLLKVVILVVIGVVGIIVFYYIYCIIKWLLKPASKKTSYDSITRMNKILSRMNNLKKKKE